MHSYIGQLSKNCVSGAKNIQNILVLVSRGLRLIGVNMHYTKFTLWSPKLQILAKTLLWRNSFLWTVSNIITSFAFSSVDKLSTTTTESILPWLQYLIDTLTFYTFSRANKCYSNGADLMIKEHIGFDEQKKFCSAQYTLVSLLTCGYYF